MLITRPNVGVGYGDIGRPLLAFEAYRALVRHASDEQLVQEAGTTADFATFLYNTNVRPTFFDAFDYEQSNWRQYVDTFSVPNFKQIESSGLKGFPQLLRVGEGGEYLDAEISEIPGPKVRVYKYGRLFSYTWEMFVNDDTNVLREIPEKMGIAARATLDNHVMNVIENPGTAYDGVAFFHVNHGNLITTAFSEAGLAEAYGKLRLMTDENGRRIGLRPGQLVTPPDLDLAAMRVLNSTEITQPGTGLGSINPVYNMASHVSEASLSDANNWYLFANNPRRPAFRVAFLDAIGDRPQLMLQNPQMRYVMGGGGQFDPYTMLHDEIAYKIRWAYAAVAWEYRSVIKANVA